MLKIRDDQMQAFGRDLRRRFVESEVSRMRREQPALAAKASDAAIHQFIEYAIARAAVFELVAVGDVQRFVDLHFRLGRGFEDMPAHLPLRMVLEAVEVAGQLRLDRIDRLLAADAANAASAGD